ncbi:MAG: Mth938-like domain-containing protein [Burkholderiales bacterium]
MKLHLATTTAHNTFTGYGVGFVLVNGRKLTKSAIITAETIIEPWAASGFDALTAEDFQSLLKLSAEVILLGSGATFRFLHPTATRVFSAAHIGVEIMDTPAACRTYNVLLAEGRKVVAAIVIE